MTIPIRHDKEPCWMPVENCVFCYDRTRYWNVKRDVAVCPTCATLYRVADIPTKQEWCAAVRLALQNKTRYVSPSKAVHDALDWSQKSYR